ncbi:MAG: 16S rRNA (cytosine(1402)-N(4))-methyltransferase RsmH [Myxococcales bacterium]|nr:16S rRNA (cytosine(1402)-N(4))-methyltransferase RsmH [Myxococcales bacterium]MCB9627678.1 16S rRNA (cytosine(1402)-N(4))-methyltransferase RsmH [Sandaracinaceae bacterium]
MSAFQHIPVLYAETLAALELRAGAVYVDCTLGGAGHAAGILEGSAPDGRLIGLDRDPAALSAAHEKLAPFGERVTIVHAPFGSLRAVLADLGVERVHGVLADVGVSSPQLDVAERGFSFGQDGPLDMRMDTSSGETAAELIDRLSADELADVLYQLGEERRSRPIARSIKNAQAEGRLETTADLRAAVVRVMGPRSGKIDSATRTFQALRLAVNGELDQLRALVTALPDVLHDEGVVAIISFHSLEDRIVKWAFRDDPCLTPTIKRPVTAGEAELAANPRARTAKLRAARRVPREVAA